MTVTFHDHTIGTITSFVDMREGLRWMRRYAVIVIERRYLPSRTIRIPVESIGGLRGGEVIHAPARSVVDWGRLREVA